MSETTSAPARGTLSTRPSNSRQLLQRKQLDRAAQTEPSGEALEDAFPAAAGAIASDPADQALTSSSAGAAAPSSPAAPAAPALPAPSPAWSTGDESAFQAMAARRKASGFQRRGKDVSGQLLRVASAGNKPNDGTVMAVIVGIVAEHGTVTRADLIDLMAKASWQNPKTAACAKDRAWCTGWASGTLRAGFIVVADSAAAVA